MSQNQKPSSSVSALLFAIGVVAFALLLGQCAMYSMG